MLIYIIALKYIGKTFSAIKQIGGNKAMVTQLRTEIETEHSAEANFSIGEVIEVKISGIQLYGAFGIIKRNNIEYTGLIYQNNINKDDKKPLVSSYFKVGDIVKVEVSGFSGDKNMSLSTVNYSDLLPYYGDATPRLSREETDVFYRQVKPMIDSVLPVITLEAEMALKSLLQEQGIVQFCLSLGKIAPTFNIDPGLLLAEKIRSEQGRSL